MTRPPRVNPSTTIQPLALSVGQAAEAFLHPPLPTTEPDAGEIRRVK